ncbi:MAG TPA: hypothetical protein VIM58_07260, partial [Candidatus Methylacidiphilales bacterium]
MADSAAPAPSAPTGSDLHPHYVQPDTVSGDVKTIGHDFVVWYHRHFSVEDLLLFLLCLAGGVVVSFLLHRVAGGRLRAWFGQKDPILGDRIVRALTAPLWVFVCFYFFTLGLDQLAGLPRSAAVRIGELAPLIYILAGFLFSFRCMDILTEVLKRRWADEDGKLDEQWAKLVGGLGKIVVVLLGILTILPKDRILPLL